MFSRAAIFLGLVLFSLSLSFCTKRREPGPVRIWLDLTEAEAGVINGALAEMKGFMDIEAVIDIKPMDKILKDFDSPEIEKLEVPDIIEVDIYRLEEARPRVMDLSKYANEEFEMAGLYLSGLKPAVNGDKIHFLPYRLSWPVMVYNCVELEKPPKTWDELFTLAEEEPGRIGLQGLSSEGLVLVLVSWIWQAGGDPYSLVQPHTRDAFYFLQKLGKQASMSSRAYRETSIARAQETGEIIIHFNGPDQVGEMARGGTIPSPNCTAPMPGGTKSARVAVAARYLAVPFTSRHPEEAVKCLRFLTTIRVQSKLVNDLYWPPVRRDAWPWEDEATSKAMEGFMQSANAGVGIEARGDFEEVSKLWVEAYQEIVFDGATVEDTLWKYHEMMDGLKK